MKPEHDDDLRRGVATTLLAVRDDGVCGVLTEALRLVGRRVQRVRDGRELFWRYVTAPHAVDLVVSDMRLSVYSIFDVADAWREYGRLPRLLLVPDGGVAMAVTHLEQLCRHAKLLSSPVRGRPSLVS